MKSAISTPHPHPLTLLPDLNRVTVDYSTAFLAQAAPKPCSRIQSAMKPATYMSVATIWDPVAFAVQGA